MKLLNKRLAATTLGILVFLFLANIAAGQIPGTQIPGTEPSPVTSVGGLRDVLSNVVRWVYIIFFIFAVMFIIFAAFSYLTAGGDAEKVTTAKNQIIYAAIAIVVALLAVGFQQIILQFLRSPSTQ